MLSRTLDHARRLAHDERGATAIEYTFIAALIALAIIAGATTIGTTLNGFFETVASGL